MAIQVRPTENYLLSTIESLRTRALRLELEAAAIRSDIDSIAVLAAWSAQRQLPPHILVEVPVTEEEVTNYRRMLRGQFSDDVLRLVLKAHRAAHLLMRSLSSSDHASALEAILQTLHQVAAERGLEIPEELEAAIGD